VFSCQAAQVGCPVRQALLISRKVEAPVRGDPSLRELSLACPLPDGFCPGIVADLAPSSTVVVSLEHLEALPPLIDELQAEEIRQQILVDSSAVAGETLVVSVGGGLCE
jgi:hypothetical protein